MPVEAPSQEELRRLYEQISSIAVVGASGDPLKPGNFVARYLKAYGFRVVPINPRKQELFGEPCYATLLDMADPPDVVQVFRPAEEAPAIVNDAIAVGAKCVWLQLGLHSDEAAGLARDAGLFYVEDNCMGVVHGQLGLGPGLHLGDEWHRGLNPVVLEPGAELPALRVTSGPDKGRTIRLDGDLLLGVGVEGPGRLRGDEHISRTHARVSRTPHHQILLRDLDSSNGTFVNGARISQQVLAIGDTIQLAFTTLEVEAPSRRDSLSAIHDRTALAQATAMRAVAAPTPGDAERFRAQFPVFEHVEYLNTGTDGPVPARALEAAAARIKVVLQQGRTGDAHRKQLQAIGHGLRSHYARVLGCDPAEIALTGSTNDGVNTVVWGLHLRRRDEILTTDEEHPSLLAPLASVKRRLGVEVRRVPFAEIANAIGPRTRLVACSHVSWVTGQLVDTAALAAADVPVLLDGAQAAGAIPVDVKELGCDYYAGAGQKWLCGPDGSGFLFVAADRLDTLTPPWPSYFSLGDARPLSIAEVKQPLDLIYHAGARRFDMSNVLGTYAMWALASLEVLESAGWGFIHQRGPELADRFAAQLRERGVEVEPRGRSTLVSWRSPDCDQAVDRLAHHGMVLRSITARDLVRASIGAWNSEDKLAALVELAA